MWTHQAKDLCVRGSAPADRNCKICPKRSVKTDLAEILYVHFIYLAIDSRAVEDLC